MPILFTLKRLILSLSPEVIKKLKVRNISRAITLLSGDFDFFTNYLKELKVKINKVLIDSLVVEKEKITKDLMRKEVPEILSRNNRSY